MRPSAACTASPAEASPPTVAGVTSGGSRARQPSARTIGGVESAGPAPAACNRAASVPARPSGAPSPTSTLELAVARGEVHALEHRDLVLDELADRGAGVVDQRDPAAQRAQLRCRLQRLAPRQRGDEVDDAIGRRPDVARDREQRARLRGVRPRSARRSSRRRCGGALFLRHAPGGGRRCRTRWSGTAPRRASSARAPSSTALRAGKRKPGGDDRRRSRAGIGRPGRAAPSAPAGDGACGTRRCRRRAARRRSRRAPTPARRRRG